MPLPTTSLIDRPNNCQRPTARRRAGWDGLGWAGDGVVISRKLARWTAADAGSVVAPRDEQRGQRHDRADDAGAEQHAFHRARHRLAEGAIAGFAEQRADSIQPQARTIEAIGEQREAAAHQ